MRFWKFLIISILLLTPALAFGQEDGAVIAFVDDPYEIEVDSLDYVDIGSVIPSGSTVSTYATAAELSLPDGSIIRLSEDTTFTLESLRNESQESRNVANVVVGRLRTVVSRGMPGNTEVRTPSAVCGVRGTDFGVNVVPGAQDQTFVVDGLIDYSKVDSAGDVIETIEVAGGEFADALSESFAASPIPEDVMNFINENMSFQELDPTDVPGHTTAQAQDDSDADVEPEDTAEPETETAAADDEEGEDGEEEPETPAEPNPIMEWLQDVLGMEIGTVTIDGTMYQKAVIQPQFEFGQLKLGLYLPVIYSSDMFNPDDWYKPDGNSEWSFGTDEAFGDDMIARVGDFFSDLALKIRYFEWGDNRDDFYLRVGNLSTMTIGHGILMEDFANDTDFPAVRRVGINTGVDFGAMGVEAVVNDIAAPTIFGGRLFWKPIHGVYDAAVGLSAIT
ncbi:MAG: FecR domain-containing protein, partial [Spirochaetia bacterium]